MKKLGLAILALTALAATSLTFAATNTAKGYYTSQHPPVGLTATAAATAIATVRPGTDIVVFNASTNDIIVSVPNTPINDRVYSGDSDHVYNPSYYGYTFISLQDPNQNEFWSNDVCARAKVVVHGTPHVGYSVDVDTSSC